MAHDEEVPMDWLTRDQKFHLNLVIDELDSATLEIFDDDNIEASEEEEDAPTTG